MLGRGQNPAALLVALLVAATAAGCAPAPAPSASPSPVGSASASASPSASPTVEPVTLPDCGSIYSPELVATLTAEGRTSLGDVSAPGLGGWGSADESLAALIGAIPDRVSCTWTLPATESGSTTSIARLDPAARATVVAALTAAGYTASTVPEGDLYSIDVATEVGSYNEAHLVTDEFWFASFFSGGQSQTLTLDAAAQLLP